MRSIARAAALLLAAAAASECAFAQALGPAQGQQQAPGQQSAQSPEQTEVLALRASATAIYSDNPARTATGESATALDGLIGLRIARQSPLLFVDADVSALEREYGQGNLPGQTIPNGYLNLLAGPAGGLFTWTAMDNFGQISSAPFEALIANDRQNVNILSTGPNLRVPLDRQDHVELAVRYGLDTFSDRILGDHNYTGKADFAHDLGSASQLGLIYEYQHTVFRDVRLMGARVNEAFAKYALAGARSYVVLEAGADQLTQPPVQRARTHHLLALLQRHLTERLTFEIAYRHGYTNSAQAFVAGSRDPFTAGAAADQNVEARAAPFLGSQGYAQLTRTSGRLLAAVEVIASHETYPSDHLSDRQTWGTNLSGDYQLSSKLTLIVRGGFWKEKYQNAGQDGSWEEGSLGLTRQLGPSLELSLVASRAKGTGNVLLSPFTENRAVLELLYAPGEKRRLYDTRAPFRFYDRPVMPPSPGPPPL